MAAKRDYSGSLSGGIIHRNAPDPDFHPFGLGLPNLRRASGGDGRILYEGPFPDRLILKFDSGGATAGKG